MALTKIKSNMVAPVLATGATTARKLEDRVVLTPLDFGAKADGVTDDSAALRAWATCGAKLLYLPAGKYYMDGAQAQAISTATYNYGDASLKACLSIPYGVRVMTDGLASQLVFGNLSAGVCGIAVGDPTGTWSQEETTIERLMIRIGGTVNGRYGIVTPAYDGLFANKRPKYRLDVHFTHSTDSYSILPVGWDVGVLIGDTIGGAVKVTGNNTYNCTLTDVGQHDSAALKVKSIVGAYGLDMWVDVGAWRTFVELGDGLEGFILQGEGLNGWYGVNCTNSASEPGGYIDNFHANVNGTAYRIANRSQIHIGKVEAYRGPAFDHGGNWTGLEVVASTVDVDNLNVNHADSGFNNTLARGLRSDATSVVKGDKAQVRSVPVFWDMNGSVDCRWNTVETNGVTTVYNLTNSANDFEAGNVRVRNVAPTAYFATDGTVDKRRLLFPKDTLIQSARRLVTTITAAGTYTVKPRLTPSVHEIVMNAGTAAFTYDIILDKASAIDGDFVHIKIFGSSSANPTVRVCNDSTAGILSTFSNIGLVRLDCLYHYDHATNAWRRWSVVSSAETTY